MTDTSKKTTKQTPKRKEIKDKTCPVHGTDMISTATGLYCPYCKGSGWGD